MGIMPGNAGLKAGGRLRNRMISIAPKRPGFESLTEGGGPAVGAMRRLLAAVELFEQVAIVSSRQAANRLIFWRDYRISA